MFVPMIAAADVAPSDSKRFAFVPPALFSVFAVHKVAKCLLFLLVTLDFGPKLRS